MILVTSHTSLLSFLFQQTPVFVMACCLVRLVLLHAFVVVELMEYQQEPSLWPSRVPLSVLSVGFLSGLSMYQDTKSSKVGSEVW